MDTRLIDAPIKVRANEEPITKIEGKRFAPSAGPLEYRYRCKFLHKRGDVGAKSPNQRSSVQRAAARGVR